MLEPKIDLENSEEEPLIDQPPPEETDGTGSGEEQFTDVTFDDIDREELPENLRGAYDDLSDRFTRMQAAYTQKTQDISASSEDAGNWRSIANNPELSNYMLDAINRVSRGESLATPSVVQTEPEQLPDAEEDPVGFIGAIVEQKLASVLDERLPKLTSQINQVSTHVRNQQADLEFENLCAEYPAAKVIGSERLNAIRAKHGNTLSMEEALGIASIGQPDALFSADRKRTPSGNKTKTRVEQSQGVKTGKDTMDVPKDIKSLRKAALALDKEGNTSFRDIGRRALEKIAQRGGSA